jgi:parallel beta-helix repeat protein
MKRVHLVSVVALVGAAACAPAAAIQVPALPPVSAPASVCGNTQPGPTTAPTGSVSVPAGNNSNMTFTFRQAGTTFWFAPGVHTLGTSEYDQIIPGAGATFLGAPGAVLDGQGKNRYAFTQQAANVTIRYLEIRGFNAPRDEGVVNHDSGNGWVIEHNTIHHNQGAALMAGAKQVVRANCLRDNGQYAMNAFKAGNTITGLLVEGNEITGNNTQDWETKVPGCGCTGGIKFWAVNGADIRNNWVHHNHGPGLWADTNNNDFLIENNLIEGNDGMGIFYEISYNAVIRSNTIRNNAWKQGQEFAGRKDTFPIGAIYLSEAGGEPLIPARTSQLEITGNDFTNNYGGVVGWENADRFCGTNTTADCTRLAKTSECVQPGISSEPLYSRCRWKTKHLNIHHNTFAHDPAVIGCSTYCGRSALFANFGTWPDWSPYKGDRVQKAITSAQDNRWHDNTYLGPWRFTPYDMGHSDPPSVWQAAPYNQDPGSTFNGVPPSSTVPPVTTTTTAATTTAPPVTTVPPSTTTVRPTVTATTSPPATTTTKTKPPCR